LSKVQIETIRGGWKNVPDHLKTKTQLNQMGLKPIGDPVAEVWNSHQWCKLYNLNDTKEKKKLTEKQLAGIKKAQITRQKNEELRWEEEERKKEEYRREYGLLTFGSWYKKDFVILDTETTDLDGEIIEIAIMDRNGNVLFNSLVKPKHPISESAQNIHGISDSMIKDAPSWPEIFPKVYEILKDRLILIYNAEFDLQMIMNSCQVRGMEKPLLNTECVMRTFALYYELERWVSLQSASNTIVTHRSVNDCLNTLKVIKEVWHELGLCSI
jgi:DNA polymerase III subunit epsilon